MNAQPNDARRLVTNSIVEQRAIPVVRAKSPEQALEICARLVAAELTVVELTATIPDWRSALETARRKFPTAIIGMGTIHTAADVIDAHEGGAQFIVSPYPAEEARRAASDVGTLFIGGGMTPGEIAAASEHGLCKLFPAHVGGSNYLRTLKAVIPDAQIMPTGGIAVTEVAEWLAAGATAVGIGADLYAAKDFDAKLETLRDQLGAP